MTMVVRALVTFVSAGFLAATPATAQDFQSYLRSLAEQARAEGVSDATIRRMTTGLTPNQRVIELDQTQPGSGGAPGTFPRLAPYLATHVDAARISGGKRMMSSLAGAAAQIERQYGVPRQILFAIWGHETNYGAYRGNFDLARSLATLAWEGRRRELFAREFVDLLKVADRGYAREQLVGSWAGAFGNPQFLPSVYLRLATDGDGDGRANIFTNGPDTLASIANYFRDAGWRAGQPWGVRVRLSAGAVPPGLSHRMISPACPRVHVRHSQWRTVREWRDLGVQPQRSIGDDVMASLFQPDGPGTPAWLLTANYRAILEYNCSNYYAMSVGLLADEIAG